MTASHTSREHVPRNINHLRRGASYRVTTHEGTTVGEYLGMETPHGDRAILIRHRAGTESILLFSVISILQAA
jgi:hypothetical protein